MREESQFHFEVSKVETQVRLVSEDLGREAEWARIAGILPPIAQTNTGKRWQ